MRADQRGRKQRKLLAAAALRLGLDKFYEDLEKFLGDRELTPEQRALLLTKLKYNQIRGPDELKAELDALCGALLSR